MKEYIYKQLIENSPLPYLYIRIIREENKEDSKIKVLDCNKVCENTFKRTKEEIMNLNIKDILSIDVYNAFLQKLHIADKNKYITF